MSRQSASFWARFANRVLMRLVKGKTPKPRTVARMRDGARKMDRIFRLYNLLRRGHLGWRQIELGGVPVSWRNMQTQPTRVLLHIHGGSFTMYPREAYLPYANDMARKLNCAVCMPDYRLAPEHPFPAAPDDCFAVYKALLDKGYRGDQIMLAGDSAGGNLALGLLARLRAQGLAMPACVWAVSPPVDLAFGHLSDQEMDELDKIDSTLSKTALNIIAQYVPPEEARVNDLASPLLADTTGYPPIRIDTSAAEFLYKDPALYAEHAARFGTAVTHQLWDGLPHAFAMFGFIPEAHEARRDAVAFFNAHAPATDAQPVFSPS